MHTFVAPPLFTSLPGMRGERTTSLGDFSLQPNSQRLQSSMDPITITTTALGCVKLVHDLGQGIVSLRAAIQGIKGVDDLLEGFTGELDALQLSLTILDYEI